MGILTIVGIGMLLTPAVLGIIAVIVNMIVTRSWIALVGTIWLIAAFCLVILGLKE